MRRWSLVWLLSSLACGGTSPTTPADDTSPAEDTALPPEDTGSSTLEELPPGDTAPPPEDLPTSDVATDAGFDVPTVTDSGRDVPATTDTGRDAPVTVDTGRDVPVVLDTGRDVPVVTDTGRDVPVVLDTGRDVPVVTDTGRDVPVVLDTGRDVPVVTDVPTTPPVACAPAAGGGTLTTAAPTLLRNLADSWQEGWLASPAVADLDADGANEVIAARGSRLVVWRADGTVRWSRDLAGAARIWASPVVGDFTTAPGLEVAVAGGARVFLYTSAGALAPGFPVTWRDELRGLAAGDLDGDRVPELVATTTQPLTGAGQRDLVTAFRANGAVLRGFPPNTSGAAMCDPACTVTGGFDQNIALGPIDSDGLFDVLAPHDNAYMSWHRGSGEAFRAATIFRGVTRSPGVRFLHDYPLAQQGWAPDENTANQAHFTNTAPAIADLDGDGTRELIAVGSVQNAAQTDRRRGVALWVVRSDGTRPAAWTSPFHVPTYLSGLSDFDGTNVVALTNSVAVADVDASAPGREMVFAGFDGRIHCVGADRVERWNYRYTTATNVLTPGVVLADLSGDGRPEVVFATYSTAAGLSALYILDGRGALQQRVALPTRGSMAVPTVADLDRNGNLEVVLSLKDADDRVRSVVVYTVPGSSTNCLPWPTGRGNLLRNGYLP